MRGLRLVVDTNVLVSALLWRGTPGKLLELAGEQEIQLYTSRLLLDELGEVLHRNKLAKAVAATGLSPAQMLAYYRKLCTQVSTRQLAQPVSRDADDDVVLACALAAHADLIVSGDDDLLVLGRFAEIPIVTAAAAIALIQA